VEKIDLSALLLRVGGTHEERIHSLRIDDETLQAKVRNIVLKFTNASGSLRVEFEFDYEAQLTCVRCLTPFSQQGRIRGCEEFELRQELAEAETGAYVEDAGIFSAGLFDFGELARQTILTELPLVPCCKEDCRGLCPICGARLGDSECGCGSRAQGETSLAAAFRRAEGLKGKGGKGEGRLGAGPPGRRQR
jgi:uncharacterized metal-binding protein YceD (DUF177 family)